MSMRKFLRMFLVCLMASFGFSAYAQTDELTWDKLLGKGAGSAYTDFSGKTITSSAVYAGQASSGGDNYIQLRTTNSNSGIVTTVSGGKLKSITIDFNAKTTDRSVDIYGDNTAYTSATELYNTPKGTKLGSISAADESKTLTVTGDYTFVGLRSNNGAIYIDKITIVWEGGGSTVTVPTPTISGNTSFAGSTEVTISGTPEGGKTYYTTDGSAPTSSSTLYSAPFTITETTTVKAISYDKDGNASSVASKTFEKVTITKVANIKEFKALENDVLAELTLTNAQVLYVNDYNGKELFVRDGTGAVDLNKLGIDAKAGDILNGTIIGKRGAASGFKIAMNKDNSTDISTVTVTSGSEPSPIEITIATAGDNICDYGVLKEATIEAKGSNKTAVIGEEKLALYDRFQLKLLNDLNTDGSTYNLYGLLYDGGSYGIELVVTKVELVKEGQVAKVSEINEFISQEQGKAYELALNNAQVVYSWTSESGNTQAFVRDDSGAICFYFTKADESLAANFTTNKMLNGSIIMNNTLFNGLPEATVTSETNTEKLTFSDGSDAQPIKITAAEVSKNLNDLVLLENVIITENEGKYYVDDVQVYNGFHFDAFNDLSSFVGEGKTIKGIAFVNNTTYRILPIEITSGTDGIQNVVKPVVENGIRYNLAGQRVDENYKGVVIMNGKKYVVK